MKELKTEVARLFRAERGAVFQEQLDARRRVTPLSSGQQQLEETLWALREMDINNSKNVMAFQSTLQYTVL